MTRRQVLSAARIVLAVLVLAAVVGTLVSKWTEVKGDLTAVSPGSLALASALALLSLVFTLLGWRALLTDLGSPLHLAPASGVLFVGQLGKYLPGSVWSVVAQAEVAAGLGVPRQRSTVAGLLAVVMAALTGLTVGAVALPGLLPGTGGSTYLLLLLLVPAVAVVTNPKVLNALIARALRIARREPLEHTLSGRAIAVTFVTFVLAWLVLGLHVWVLVGALGADRSSALVPSLFGYALAASLGMVVPLLPAGFGLREGMLLLLLDGHLPVSKAAAVVILSRFIITIGDVIAAAVGWGYARSHRLLSAKRVT